MDPSAIPASRAQLPLRACPVCGASVEPLRAGATILLEDGLRFLCGAECRDRFREGERHRHAPRAATSSSGTGTDPVLRAFRKKKLARREAGATSSSEWTASQARGPEPVVPLPLLPLGIAGLGALAAAFAVGPALAWIAAGLSVAAALLALTAAPRRDADWLAWGLAPFGATLAAVGGVLAFEAGADARVALASAALASASAVLRAWFDATAARPLERLLASLSARMPAHARVPVEDPSRPLQVDGRDVPSERLRAGEEVLVRDGDVVPVDGVVRAGDAYVLPHPAARAPVRRRAGDPVIAGARVVDGSARILACRVGPDRALLRAARFGDGTAADAARLSHLVARGIQWGGLAVALGIGAGLLLGEAGGGLAMRISAAAGVLLAIPLLALRRAGEAPFVAAGATAAERGIVFQSARALDRAGSVDVVALSTHGTVTEGEPEVVETYAAGEDNGDEALALSAAVEAAAPGPGALARAIVRYAERRGLPLQAVVRRVALVPGRGVTAVGAGDEPIAVGSRQLLLDQGVSVAALDLHAARAEERGLRVIFVAVDKRPRVLLALRDEDRPGARAAVQRLMDMGVEVLLVSGDHRGTVLAMAKTLDVDHVRAELTPEERGVEVRRLREGGRVVAAIGRPGHDDEALGAADVPIALAAAGGPDGERAVALTSDDLRDAAAALWLASAARQEAGRAVGLALVAGAGLAALAANGFVGPGIIAVGAIAIDAIALPAAARLLRRIELRLPARG